MPMDPADLFMLRDGLVKAGLDTEAAEKVAIALERGMAKSIDEVLEKWTLKLDVVQKEMTIRFGIMIVGAVGLILSGIKLFF